MKFDEFKKELLKQIGLNSKFFKHGELQILHDFAQTISKEDFGEDQGK